MTQQMRTDDINWRPANANEALESLHRLSARMREDGDNSDHRTVFLDLYGIVTAKVVELMENGQHGFIRPDWLFHLTGRFAEEALIPVREALKGRPVLCPAWRFATHYSQGTTSHPARCAMLGVSAHINNDLSQVVYEDIVLREGPRPSRETLKAYKHDYFRVNWILASVTPDIVRLLADRYECSIARMYLRSPLPLSFYSATIMEGVKFWRYVAWRDAVAMLNANSENERRAIAANISHRAGRLAQLLIAPNVVDARLRGEHAPFRLSRSVTSWPGVHPVAMRAPEFEEEIPPHYLTAAKPPPALTTAA